MKPYIDISTGLKIFFGKKLVNSAVFGKNVENEKT